MSSIKINKDEGKRVHIWIKSAIGTPNRRQYKHKNIMYPYFRMYKSPYRARDSRTRQAFWPCVDKYPWHTHQKRWVKSDNLNVKFFAEFTNKPSNRKNLFETCHTLPFNGINCLFWNPIYFNSYKFILKNSKKEDKQDDNENLDEEGAEINNDIQGDTNNPNINIIQGECNELQNKKIIRINNYYYIVEKEGKNNMYFHLKYIQYSMRPFRGKIIGDLYINDKKIRSNIAPKGAVNGEWKYAYPHIHINEKIANNTLNYTITDMQITDQIIKNLVIADKNTYRPPLPKCFNQSK
ncbi:hypothetical protein YYC_00708 [Plasmodium yoelii 17X]|uniref:Uncharacterized protein n=1 Tax=Plasmodium yoelii 17X TaxID=1323249 RepID=V7PU34_PLAYE|nr:hypothetical protein YYC_00708 [Plasmodium yoelii 17X]